MALLENWLMEHFVDFIIVLSIASIGLVVFGLVMCDF